MQDLSKVENKIADYQAQILAYERDIEKAELLLKSIDVKDTIKQDCEMYNSSHFDFFKERQVQVDQNIKKLTAKLANFDAEFFVGL